MHPTFPGPNHPASANSPCLPSSQSAGHVAHLAERAGNLQLRWWAAPLLVGLAVSLGSPAVRAESLAAGTLLRLNGTFSPVDPRAEDGELPPKSFEVQLLVTESQQEDWTALWSLTESGPGGWPWVDRFGTLRATGGQAPQGTGPALLYQREDGQSVVPLPTLLFSDGEARWEPGGRWTRDGVTATVTGPQPKQGRSCWRIDTETGFGPQQTTWKDVDSPRICELQRRVVIGRGQRFELQLRLVSETALTAEAMRTLATQFEALASAREQLEFQPRLKERTWTEAQLESLAERLGQIPALTVDAPGHAFLADVLKSANSDRSQQSTRSRTLDVMRKRAIDSKPPLSFVDLRGQAVDALKWRGHCVVLHFWDYQDRPLEQPYGQAGFLDFLSREHSEAGLLVFGVVAPPAAGQMPDDERVRAARRFARFMNLSYPLLVSQNGLLETLGDPRVAGGKLPLYVVLGPDGKLLEYHAGLYEVERNRGLKELEQLVLKAMREQ